MIASTPILVHILYQGGGLMLALIMACPRGYCLSGLHHFRHEGLWVFIGSGWIFFSALARSMHKFVRDYHLALSPRAWCCTA
ncbi:hypothetical protein F4823DRAFT_458295 [Ustulina deusta]|nr:hypothetical protein F4823DRAFT_458295 [Ustulina deusta]